MNLELFPEQAIQTEPAQTRAHEAACRVLVVDDEESMREYATEALAYGDYQATAVDGGEAAIKALHAEQYDLVLTDFNMPKGSGSDLIIKMHSQGFMMPVIMMTGSALTKELLALTSMLHVSTILQKPFQIDELLNAVDRALRPVQMDSGDLAHHEVATGMDLPHEPRKRNF